MEKCKFCGYRWESRKKSPVACPRCKRYLSWKPQSHFKPHEKMVGVGNTKTKKVSGVEILTNEGVVSNA